jgi:hypothetical protein
MCIILQYPRMLFHESSMCSENIMSSCQASVKLFSQSIDFLCSRLFYHHHCYKYKQALSATIILASKIVSRILISLWQTQSTQFNTLLTSRGIIRTQKSPNGLNAVPFEPYLSMNQHLSNDDYNLCIDSNQILFLCLDKELMYSEIHTLHLEIH